MHRFSVILRLAIPFFTITFLPAQDIPPPPIEWGTLTPQDIALRSFPADTNAAAVVLCDFGETRLRNDFQLEYKRHLRVKILNQNGFDWGTHSITLYTEKKDGEEIDDIEGITYVIDSIGAVKEFELDEDDIFEEKLAIDQTRYKFTLPNLQPGCIIEVRYTIISKRFGSVRGWEFQDREPVLWSEYRLLHPSQISFTALTRGYERFAVNDKSEFRQVYSGDVASYFGQKILNSYFWRWAMKDIPALRNEPYITTLNDYVSQVDLQLAAYALNTGGVQYVLKTWESLVNDLYDSPYYGQMIRISGAVEEATALATRNTATPLERMKAIYQWVSSSLVWTRTNAMYPDQNLSEVLKTKKGSAAEINYTMLAMLRAAGVTADPVIASTRSNGAVQEVYPLARQFNYGLVRATIGGRHYYLDATDPNRPYDLLPARLLGVRALIVQKDKVEWVTLSTPIKSAHSSLATIQLSGNGAIIGTIEGTFRDYANLSVRSDLKERKTPEVLTSLFSLNAAGITLDSSAVENHDSLNKPVVVKAWVSSDHYAQTSGEMIYLNPHIISRLSDNPFKSPTRKFPVDYNYPREYLTVVNITLPDSFEVKETVANKRFALNRDVIYSRSAALDGNRLQLISKLEILSREIAPQYYAQLRELYATMIQSESEQIVLQKKPAPAPEPPVPAPEPPKKPAPAKKRK